MKKIYFLLILAIFVNCHQQKSDKYYASEASATNRFDEAEAPAPSRINAGHQGAKLGSTTDITENVQPKKIIKDGRMGIEVKDIHSAKQKIDSLVALHKGYISSENFNNYSYALNFSLNIKIPANSFEKFIANIEQGSGKVTYKNINVRDVTEQFIDLEKRLANKKKYDKQYSELLKQARTIKDILEIQTKQRMIQEEIESTEGRLKYLRDQVSFSTLKLELNQKVEFTYEPEEKDNFFQRLWQSIHKGWQAFVDFILFLFKLWPFWIAGIAIWRIIRKIRKKKTVKSKK